MPPTRQDNNPPRQIVLLMTDTQRTDMVGCYGHPPPDFPDMTPCLDRLAGQGVRFERAYTCSPVCGPARAAIFTGTFPHSNGSWGNSMPVGQGIKHIGQRLRDAGLHTAYIGKWHLDASDYFGTGQCPDGWDPQYWYDMRCYLEELSPAERLRSRQPGALAGGPGVNRDPNLTAEFTYAHRCSNRAIDFLSAHGAEDFLLVVSYDEPHHPYVCPRPFSEMYRGYEFPKSPNVWDRLENKPAHQRAWAGDLVNEDKDAKKILLPDLLGCNSFVDFEIGRVVAAIDRRTPGALVIYLSDHGDMLYSHCLTNKGPAMYDEITRVPMIVRWPAAGRDPMAGGTPAPPEGVAGAKSSCPSKMEAPAGTVCTLPVSQIDLVPTILEAAGVAIPKTLDGQSLLATIRDPGNTAGWPVHPVFMEFHRYEVDHDGFGGFQPIRAAFDGRYKLVINLLTTDELYDLHSDPYEMTNLIESADHAAARDALHDQILEWMNATRDPFRGYYWERRPWRTDARAATWDYTAMTRQRENEPGERRQLVYETGLEMKDAVRRKDVLKHGDD